MHRDKALQNFHTLKIREINKIIRELWQLIYKGQDIDSIEIESGQEEGAAATKTTRSYNYRVVMRKGELFIVSCAFVDSFCCGFRCFKLSSTGFKVFGR